MSDTNLQQCQQPRNSYDSGHPWYYRLGGKILTPKEILASVKENGYRGYRADDLAKIEARPEPQRSQALRSLRLTVLTELKHDLHGYRRVVRALNLHRKENADSPQQEPDDIWLFTNVGLKHNHLYNDFAHLAVIDEMLMQQPDLFGF